MECRERSRLVLIAAFTICTLAFATSTVAAPGDITTIAGKGIGDGYAATEAMVGSPQSLHIAADGSLYISDVSLSSIRRIDASGKITTVAGNGERGFSGDGGPATDASFYYPWDVAVDADGNIYICDMQNNRVRKVGTSGIITTVAGGDVGDGGPATETYFSGVNDAFVDAQGNVYIADAGNALIRKVDASGVITTVAGGGSKPPGDGGAATDADLSNPRGVFVDGQGNIYFADWTRYLVLKVDADGIISTVAGNGKIESSGDGGPATDAGLSRPDGLFVDGQGNVYIAESYGYRVRKVDASGVITTVAGNGDMAYSGDGGPATEASLNRPSGVFMDAHGNLYIADTGNHRVRKVDTSGTITTAAGDSTSGLKGDGGPATEASLRNPQDIFGDASGNLFVADAYNYRIRKIDSSGTISSVAGGGSSSAGTGDGGPATDAYLMPYGLHLDGAGSIYFADNASGLIRKVDSSGTITAFAGGDIGDGGPATETHLRPMGICLDAEGSLYIGDSRTRRVRKVDPAGLISTLAGGGKTSISEGVLATEASLGSPQDLFHDSAGALHVVLGNRLFKVDASGAIVQLAGGGRATAESGAVATDVRFTSIYHVYLDELGNYYIPDRYGQCIWKLDPSGILTRVAGNGERLSAGDGGPATDASVYFPRDVIGDSAGNLYIAETGGRIRKVDSTGTITNYIGTYMGDNVPATTSNLGNPFDVCADGQGNIYIAEPGHSRVRKIDPDGTITTIAGGDSSGYGGDGGPATDALLSGVYGVAMDGSGNLYIADASNHRVRQVDASGTITTVAGSDSSGYAGDGGPATDAALNYPRGVCVDASGVLYISDSSNSRVRKVDSSGSISTIAGTGDEGFTGDGGPATDASLYGPYRTIVGPDGALFISDKANYRVRKVDPSGTITTIAGTGLSDYSGDGGPATDAAMGSPIGLALDSAGNLYVADQANHRVRMVDASGIISTVVGAGTDGDSGDGGPATDAELGYPAGLFIDGSGHLYIADYGNDRIRRVESIATAVAPGPPSPDFDASGKVDFQDFVLFAQSFGKKAGDEGWDAGFDLNEGGSVDFNDFVIFAQSFGKAVGKPATRPVGAVVPGANPDAGLTLVPLPGEDNGLLSVAVRVADAAEVRGYSVRIAYDPSALELAEATGHAGSVFARRSGQQPVALQEPALGDIGLADMLEAGATVSGTDDLVILTFRVLDTTLPGQVEIAEAILADASGRLNVLVASDLQGLRALPSDYALSRNIPNPFNPDTQILYQLPENGPVSLVVYNLLGQQVRVLVDREQPPGYYQVAWDGRDALGRNVSSGIYLYRFASKGLVQTRRMLLLK